MSEGHHQAGPRGVDGASAVLARLRPAKPADCRPIWQWRNDEETRRQSLDSSFIPYEAHERWFAEALASDRRKLYVVLVESPNACVIEREAAGVVRLDLDGSRGTVSIHLAPGHRGRGLGTAALRALANLAFEELAMGELVASVKQDNRASLAAFEKAGFAVEETGAVTTLRRCRSTGGSGRREAGSASADGPPTSAPAAASVRDDRGQAPAS